MIETSETTKTLDAALLGVQGAVLGVVCDAQNPHFRSKYATLEAVLGTLRPHLQSAGIVVMQCPGAFRDGVLELTTRISHPESGEWMAFQASTPLAKIDPQGVGAAITYLSRYGLMAFFTLPPVDDDAESAVQRETTDDLIKELKKTKTPQELSKWGMDNAERVGKATGVKARVNEAYTSHMSKLGGAKRTSARDGTPYKDMAAKQQENA